MLEDHPVRIVVRRLGLIVFAVFASFSVVFAWKWTAPFTWSSDRWLMAIPLVFVALGLVSVIALAVLRKG